MASSGSAPVLPAAVMRASVTAEQLASEIGMGKRKVKRRLFTLLAYTFLFVVVVFLSVLVILCFNK